MTCNSTAVLVTLVQHGVSHTRGVLEHGSVLLDAR